MPRRFPPPWRAVPAPGGYAVEDANGVRLAFVYGSDAAHVANSHGLTLDEARRIAVGIARLPEMMGSD